MSPEAQAIADIVQQSAIYASCKDGWKYYACGPRNEIIVSVGKKDCEPSNYILQVVKGSAFLYVETFTTADLKELFNIFEARYDFLAPVLKDELKSNWFDQFTAIVEGG